MMCAKELAFQLTDIKNLKLEMCSQWISMGENVADS